MIDFSGFSLPVWYDGISQEHIAVRKSVGLFDVSHMGRFRVEGRNATSFLDHMLTTDLSEISDGKAFYSLLCNESGGIVDDVITLREDESNYLMVVNSSNRQKDYSWLRKGSIKYEVTLNDISDSVALLALQGPKAEAVLQRIVDFDPSHLTRFTHRSGRISEEEVIVSRTGYTGENGYEIFILHSPLNEPTRAIKVWEKILSEGRSLDILPCGLGARDTLRLEAGFSLYGADIDETISPLEARLEWVVNFGGDFVGKAALEKQKTQGLAKIRVGLVMKDRSIPRAGCKIVENGKLIGVITSGSFSPLLRVGIALGYVSPVKAEIKSRVEIMIRGSPHEAEITNPPFYDTGTYGWNRVKARLSGS